MPSIINPITRQKYDVVDSDFPASDQVSSENQLSSDSKQKTRKVVKFKALGIASVVMLSSWCVYAGIHGLIFGFNLINDSPSIEKTYTLAERLLEGNFCRGGQKSDFCEE